MAGILAAITLTSPTTLEANGVTYACSIGKGGLVASDAKCEGDLKTPKGVFSLRCCYYRPDRVTPVPITALPFTALSPSDGWCDDPASAQYNQPVQLPFAASHEKLWRDDHAYDLIIPLGYNDAPVIAGKGSAIFLHCMHDDGKPTAGCVALRRDDLLRLLPHLSTDTVIRIG